MGLNARFLLSQRMIAPDRAMNAALNARLFDLYQRCL